MNKNANNNGRYQTIYMSMGLPFGAVIGTAMAQFFNLNLVVCTALGTGLGLSLGIIIGTLIDKYMHTKDMDR